MPQHMLRSRMMSFYMYIIMTIFISYGTSVMFFFIVLNNSYWNKIMIIPIPFSWCPSWYKQMRTWLHHLELWVLICRWLFHEHSNWHSQIQVLSMLPFLLTYVVCVGCTLNLEFSFSFCNKIHTKWTLCFVICETSFISVLFIYL